MATEGNLSSRIEDERILTTVSGVCKGELSPDDFVLVDLEGRVIDGDRPPSTELKMHLEVYRQRRDVRAVIHAHPAHVVSLTAAGGGSGGALRPAVNQAGAGKHPAVCPEIGCYRAGTARQPDRGKDI